MQNQLPSPLVRIVFLDADPNADKVLQHWLEQEFPGVSVSREDSCRLAISRIDLATPTLLFVDAHTVQSQGADLAAFLHATTSAPNKISVVTTGWNIDARRLLPPSLRERPFWVKCSDTAKEDLGHNILATVRQALRRLRVYWLIQGSESAPDDAQLREPEHADPSTSQHKAMETVRQALPAYVHQTILQRRHLRCCLALAADQPSTSTLPWEGLVSDSPDGDASPLSVVRVFARPQPVSRPRGGRIRAVWGLASPVDRERLTGDAGRAAIDQFVKQTHSLELEPIRSNDGLEAHHIAAACKVREGDSPVDILHLVCHAECDESEGRLILCNRFQDSIPTSGKELAAALTPCPPRIVVLEACPSGLGPYGVSAELIRIGVDAVISFIASPTQLCAGETMTALYRALAIDGQLNMAVWATRPSVRGPRGGGRESLALCVAEESGLDTLAFSTRPIR